MARKKPLKVSPHDEVHDLLYPGIAEDFFEARQALALLRSFEQYGAEIDRAKFGLFFGAVRHLAERQLLLSLSKLYEAPSEKHLTRSLPALLHVIETNSSALVIKDRGFIEGKLAKGPFRRDALEALEPEQLTRLVVGWLRAELPQAHKAAFHKSSKRLSIVKQLRDKVIAHNERVDRASLSGLSLGDAESLLQYVEDAIALIGSGYLGIAFEFDDGARPFLKDDPARICLALKRLLIQARILPDAT